MSRRRSTADFIFSCEFSEISAEFLGESKVGILFGRILLWCVGEVGVALEVGRNLIDPRGRRSSAASVVRWLLPNGHPFPGLQEVDLLKVLQMAEVAADVVPAEVQRFVSVDLMVVEATPAV